MKVEKKELNEKDLLPQCVKNALSLTSVDSTLEIKVNLASGAEKPKNSDILLATFATVL
jgi:hypothetical protein